MPHAVIAADLVADTAPFACRRRIAPHRDVARGCFLVLVQLDACAVAVRRFDGRGGIADAEPGRRRDLRVAAHGYARERIALDHHEHALRRVAWTELVAYFRL